jgi:hypothetical protein
MARKQNIVCERWCQLNAFVDARPQHDVIITADDEAMQQQLKLLGEGTVRGVVQIGINRYKTNEPTNIRFTNILCSRIL